jgi:hypothetical protein
MLLDENGQELKAGQYSIKETTEIFDAAIGICKDALEAKPGGISKMEALKIAIGNAPASVRAAMGSGLVVQELTDIDSAEGKILANKAIELANLVMKLFSA